MLIPDIIRRQTGLTRERFPGHTLVTVEGELDIASTPDLREQLYAALRDTGPLVIVDLSGVTFCDASGLAVLLGAHRRSEARDAVLMLAAPRPQMDRLLHLTRLHRAFTVHHSVAAALGQARSEGRPAAA